MLFNTIYLEACCDKRISNGILDIKNQEHVFVLQEYMIKHGYTVDEVVDGTHTLFEKGRFPERQAYNKDGILVTFPNPEYKKRAVDKGTHFAENPKKSNPDELFNQNDLAGLSMVGTCDAGDGNIADNDSIPLEQELEQLKDTEDYDLRTKEEKTQDAEAVVAILQPDRANIDNTMSENYFFDKRGNLYDKDGNIIQEVFFDESTNSKETITH